MPLIALYDASVLYPAPLRDLLIRMAQSGAVRARWSEAILDECFAAILARRPDLDASALARTRQLMNAAVADCLVLGYEPLMSGLSLPDPDDHHVLAAAIAAKAEVIVTQNLRDFPSTALSAWDIEAVDADHFVLGLLDSAPGTLLRVLDEQRLSLRRPPTRTELLSTLAAQGTADAIRRIGERFPKWVRGAEGQ